MLRATRTSRGRRWPRRLIGGNQMLSRSPYREDTHLRGSRRDVLQRRWAPAFGVRASGIRGRVCTSHSRVDEHTAFRGVMKPFPRQDYPSLSGLSLAAMAARRSVGGVRAQRRGVRRWRFRQRAVPRSPPRPPSRASLPKVRCCVCLKCRSRAGADGECRACSSQRECDLSPSSSSRSTSALCEEARGPRSCDL